MIYLDYNTCDYFGIPYYAAWSWACSQDAYKRRMGAKLDDAHNTLLRKHRSILSLARDDSDAPGWYKIISSHI